MKKQFFILTGLLLSTSSFAAVNPTDESKTYTTHMKSVKSLTQDNITETNTLKTNFSDLSKIKDKFDKCEEKHKVYMGTGVDAADSDGCIDVQIDNSASNVKKPTWAGFFSVRKNGQISSGEPLNTSSAGETWHRLRPDMACNAEFPGARALTFDDLPYVMYDIPWNASGFQSVPQYQYMWLFDANGGLSTESPSGFTKNYYQNGTGTCDGWSSASAGLSGPILMVIAGPALKVANGNCNTPLLIGCVFN